MCTGEGKTTFTKTMTIRPFLSLALMFLITMVAQPLLGQSALVGTWQSQGSDQVIHVRAQGNALEAKVEASDWASPWLPLLPTEEGYRFSLGGRTFSLALMRDASLALTSSTSSETQYFERVSTRGMSLEASLTNHVAAPARQGMIISKTHGAAKSTASIFRAYLFRLDQGREFVRAEALQPGGQVHFEDLSAGDYLLMVSPQGPTAVRAYPRMQRIQVAAGQAAEVSIELK